MSVIFQEFIDLYTWDPVQAEWTIQGLNIDNLSTAELEALAESVRGYSLTTPQGQAFVNIAHTTLGGSPVSQIGSGTALELAQNAPLDATAENLFSVGQGAMESGAGTGVYQTTPLLSLDVGAVGAAVAPLLGVAAGSELYSANPNFWTLLSEKLLPFCYPGTTKIPAWMDIVESAIHPGTYESNVIIDKEIYDAINELFNDLGISTEDSAKSELDTSPLTQPIPLSNYGALYQSNNRNWFFVANRPIIMVNANVSSSFYNLVAIFASETYNDTVGYYQEERPGVPTNPNYMRCTQTATVNGKTFYYSYVNLGFPISGVTSYEGFTRVETQWSFSNTANMAYTLLYGFTPANIPEGTTKWEGNKGSTATYSKPIVYMVEDPLNPGSFIPESKAGISIAVPAQQTGQTPATVELTKPDNWPEGEDWPMTIPFPWSAPEGYEGEWPTTMPWPLPLQQPDWWPDVIPYPSITITDPASVDPVTNPDPNVNANPANPIPYLVTSVPGQAVSPAIQTVPQPVLDPTTVMQPTTPVTTITDVLDPAIPVPEGITPLPIVPTIPLPFSTGNDGLISVYHPTDAQLKAFASWLWVTYADPSIEKLWNNPFDGVIGLMELYCTPTDIGNKTIRSGFLDSGVSSAIISRYTKIDCGSLTVPEYYGNYLDYSPYSKCHVYLPFIGIVELNVDDIVGHAVNITYVIDEYNGSCIAQITVAKSIEVGGEDVDYSNLMYQFSGNCAVELPLAGGTQAAIRAGLIQAAAYGLSSVIGGVVSGVSGNIGGAISQIGYGAANAIGSVVSAKSSVQHSGSFGSSFGAMGVKKPYIIVTRPKQIDVVDYNKLYGYPAHAAVTVGSCTGYLRVREVNVASSTASDEEKKRIEELLKEGIYME